MGAHMKAFSHLFGAVVISAVLSATAVIHTASADGHAAHLDYTLGDKMFSAHMQKAEGDAKGTIILFMTGTVSPITK